MNKVDNKNCVHFDDNIKTNNFNGNSHLIYDDCYENQQENESKGPGGYQLNNLYSCQCGIPEVIKLATNGPGYSSKQFRDGYGWSYCQIDDDSKLRNAKNLTNLRCLNQLQERFNLTTPYLGRGMCDAELELKLQPGEDTFQNRPCNTLAGKDMTDYHMLPMIECLKKNVQDKKHIIEEENGWVRSGIPSRQVIRNKDYLEKCGYIYDGKFWKQNKIN